MTEHPLSPTRAGSEPAGGTATTDVADAPDAPDARDASTAPASDEAVELRLSRDEAEALLLAVDALAPLLERVRREVAPEPDPEPEAEAESAADAVTTPDFDDALRRATWLARESLREARVAIGRGRLSAEQRHAWQEAARRYVAARRRAGTGVGDR
jgi:hypothetical protein